jgi:hypothetical protein
VQRRQQLVHVLVEELFRQDHFRRNIADLVVNFKQFCMFVIKIQKLIRVNI